MEVKRTYQIEQHHNTLKKLDWEAYDMRIWVAVDDLVRKLRERIKVYEDMIGNDTIEEDKAKIRINEIELIISLIQ